MALPLSSDSMTLDFFWGFFLWLDLLWHGAGFSLSSDESGTGGVFFLRLDLLWRGAGFSSSSDESGTGGVFFVGGR